MIKKLADRIINKCFHAKGNPWYALPFYKRFGKWKLCVYAMKVNWDSLRIKIEKDDCTKMIVIKKGQY